MMRRVRAALAAFLLLVHAPVFAATWTVTDDATRSSAMSGAVAGDVVNVTNGIYAGTFVPTNSGSAGAPIRIVGNQAVPGSVSCSVGLSWSTLVTKSYVSWTGFRFSDDVVFQRADHCSLTYCRVDSGGFVSYGSNSDPTSQGISTTNYVGYSTFRQNIGSNSFALVMKRTESTTIERCRFYTTITNAVLDARGRYLYRSRNNRFTDTAFFIECWGAENGEQFAQGIRDSSSGNVFTRDTMWVGLTSKRARRVLLSQSGTYPGTAGPNYWVSCDYRSWHETATDLSFEFQDHTTGGVYNTLFASRMGSALSFCAPTTNGVVFRHCTFYSGGAQAFYQDDTTNPSSTTRINGCAFVSRTAGGCSSSNLAQNFRIATLGAYGVCDSNLFAAADTAYAFRKSGGGNVCYTPRSWVVASTNDAHSVFRLTAGGMVQDTAWASLDLRPASGSPLLSNGLPEGYAGAYTAVAAEAAHATLEQPSFGLYAGAGPYPREAWQPVLNASATVLDTAKVRALSRFNLVSLNPAFADSAGPYGRLTALNALQQIRALNPRVMLVAEPIATAAYVRSIDTTDVYNWYFQSWRAARNGGGGWTSGSGAPGGAFTPGGYADSTGSRGFAWCAKPGYRGWFYQTYNAGLTVGSFAAGVAGYSNWNVNLAWQPSVGVWPVCDSLVDIVTRQFITRRHPDGSYVWDGCQWDLFTSSSSFSALGSDDIDYVRAGYASKAAFDSGWTAAHHYLMRRLREACAANGRPYFVLGGNGASGIAYDYGNGWMREGWPTLQGGSWATNFWWYPGGANNDAERFTWRPQMDWLFMSPCSGDSCAGGFKSDSVGVRQLVRYSLGTAALTGATLAFGPTFASIAKGGGYETWWYDEYAVDTVTAIADKALAHKGWLGSPLGRWYNTVPPIGTGYGAGGELLYRAGEFEGVDSTRWTRTVSSQVSVQSVSDTVHGGTRAIRARVATKQAADWQAQCTSTIKCYGTTGDTFTVTYWARADRARPVKVVLNGVTSNAVRSSWSNGSAQWVSPEGWTSYRLVGTLTSHATASESLAVAFWFGDTVGTVWLDDVTVHRGRSRGGLFVREFDRGLVVVNPLGHVDTLTLTRKAKRIRAPLDKNPDVNDGTALASGAGVVVPLSDARFLIFDNSVPDAVRPAASAIAIASIGNGQATVTWAEVGDDSLSSTAAAFELRYSTATITSGNYASATAATGPPAPALPGLQRTWTVLGLTPSTTYYFALKTSDDVGNVSALSNVPSVALRALARVDVTEGK